MKIAHCFFSMRTGGAQMLAIDLLNSQCLVHETTLIVVNDEWEPELLQKLSKKVAVHFMHRKEGSRNPLPILRFNLLLRRLKPDIIQCHERKMIRMIYYKRAKTVYTVHDVGIPTETFSRYDALVAISESVASDISQRAGIRAEVIRNGIAMAGFRKRTTYTVPEQEPFRLVQVSRLMHEKKGQDILLRAMARLVNERDCPPIQLDLIGDGPSMDFLVKLAETLQIDTLVSFRGNRDRTWVANHLADYHLLVQPSRYEGFGLTVLEGLAAGLPVVASNIDGPAEIMTGLPTGILFTSDDVEACATAVARMIQAYRTPHLETAVSETYALIGEKFSISATATGYLNLYQQLLHVPDSTVIDHQSHEPLHPLVPYQPTTIAGATTRVI